MAEDPFVVSAREPTLRITDLVAHAHNALMMVERVGICPLCGEHAMVHSLVDGYGVTFLACARCWYVRIVEAKAVVGTVKAAVARIRMTTDDRLWQLKEIEKVIDRLIGDAA